jgi:aquaporin Z
MYEQFVIYCIIINYKSSKRNFSKTILKIAPLDMYSGMEFPPCSNRSRKNCHAAFFCYNYKYGDIMKKYFAECFGTLVLVLFGCGIAVFSGVDLVATALAFGLSIVAMAYTIGPVSGCHVNPAVSFAFVLNGRIGWGEFAGYAIAQCIGAIAGAGLLYGIIVTSGAAPAVTGLGQNSYGGSISLGGALLLETVLTFVFVLVILAVTGKNSTSTGKKAGLVIGLTLTLVHLLGIRLTGTSVNPARSLGPALLLQGEAIRQVWVFFLAPLAGSILAALFGKFVLSTD